MHFKMKSEHRRSRDWIIPVVLFIPAASISAIHGGQAEILRRPTASFAQTSHFWMLVLVAVSFAIRPPKLAAAVWLSGLACVAYAPLLLAFGSSSIPLSRPLSSAELEAFRHRFAGPFVCYSASGEGDRLRVRRQDYTETMKSHLQSIDVLREGGIKGGSTRD